MVDVLDVLDVRSYFAAVGLWPGIPATAKPKHWLSNFAADELPYAEALLDSFLYFNQPITEQLFRSAFHNLSHEVIDIQTVADFASAERLWSKFLSNVLVTHPTGEVPNVSDSGYIFERKARQIIGIDEDQLLEPQKVVEYLHGKAGRHTVVLVDDFAGSGDQFVKTWHRPYAVNPAKSVSLNDLSRQATLRGFYVPAVSTAYAVREIESKCSDVAVKPAHIMPDEYAAQHPGSLVMPPSLVPGARDFLEQTTLRSGYHRSTMFGYHDLGLAIAFEHSFPDASLPIFYSERNGWIPLLRKT